MKRALYSGHALSVLLVPVAGLAGENASSSNAVRCWYCFGALARLRNKVPNGFGETLALADAASRLDVPDKSHCDTAQLGDGDEVVYAVTRAVVEHEHALVRDADTVFRR